MESSSPIAPEELDRGRIATILTDVLRAASTAGHLFPTLDAILGTLTAKLAVCLGSIYLTEERQGISMLILRAAHGVEGMERDRAEYQTGEGLTGYIASGHTLTFRTLAERQGHPASKGKYDHDLEIPETYRKNAAFLGVPLSLDGVLLGVLKLEYLQPTDTHPEAFFT